MSARLTPAPEKPGRGRLDRILWVGGSIGASPMLGGPGRAPVSDLWATMVVAIG